MLLIIPQVFNKLRLIKVADAFQVFLLLSELLLFSLLVNLLPGLLSDSLRLSRLGLSVHWGLSLFCRLFFNNLSRCSRICIYLFLALLFLFLLRGLCGCSLLSLFFLHHPLILLLCLLPLVPAEQVPACALPLVIAPPAVDLALASHSDGVMLTARNHHNLLLAQTTLNQGRRRDVLLVAHTQLTVVVQAPSVYLVL